MESKQGRRVVGRLEADTNILEGLLDICQKHAIHTGQLHAIGYLQSADVTLGIPDHSNPAAPIKVGACHAIHLTGNISMQADAPILHIQALLLETESQALRAGRLSGGIVNNIEFAIQSVDDFTLLRSEDSDELGQWVQIQPHVDSAQDQDTERTEFFPGRMTTRSRYDMPDYELEPNDCLQHPRLGPCTIIDVHDVDRVTIRLDSGRIVELHLGMFELHRTDNGKDTQKSFDVRLRKRT
jgi:predicted DNA-binding protein with PD1-like motif